MKRVKDAGGGVTMRHTNKRKKEKSLHNITRTTSLNYSRQKTGPLLWLRSFIMLHFLSFLHAFSGAAEEKATFNFWGQPIYIFVFPLRYMTETIKTEIGGPPRLIDWCPPSSDR